MGSWWTKEEMCGELETRQHSVSSRQRSHLQEAVGAGDLIEQGRAGKDEQRRLRGLVVEELEGVYPQLVLPRLDE